MTSTAPITPRKAKLRARLRAWKIRLAVRLVGRADAVVVSRVGLQAALDKAAFLAEWPQASGALAGRPKAAAGLTAHVEDLVQLLALAAEMGDPALQLDGLEQRFVALRLRAMGPKRRARLGYEAALAALERRIGTNRKPEPFSSAAQAPGA